MEEADRRSLALSAAALLELAIDPAMLQGVVDNLALLQFHASNLMGFPLDSEEEIAGVFRA